MYGILSNYSRNQLIKPTAPDFLLCHNSNIPLTAGARKNDDIQINYSFMVAAWLKGMGKNDEILNKNEIWFRDCL